MNSINSENKFIENDSKRIGLLPSDCTKRSFCLGSLTVTTALAVDRFIKKGSSFLTEKRAKELVGRKIYSLVECAGAFEKLSRDAISIMKHSYPQLFTDNLFKNQLLKDMILTLSTGPTLEESRVMQGAQEAVSNCKGIFVVFYFLFHLKSGKSFQLFLEKCYDEKIAKDLLFFIQDVEGIMSKVEFARLFIMCLEFKNYKMLEILLLAEKGNKNLKWDLSTRETLESLIKARKFEALKPILLITETEIYIRQCFHRVDPEKSQNIQYDQEQLDIYFFKVVKFLLKRDLIVCRVTPRHSDGYYRFLAYHAIQCHLEKTAEYLMGFIKNRSKESGHLLRGCGAVGTMRMLCITLNWVGSSVSSIALNSALRSAAYRRSLRIIEALLFAGAEINATDGKGWTPLNHALFGSDFRVIQKCLDEGAEINAQDNEGRSPLYQAVYQGGSSAAKKVVLLLEAGANHNQRANNGLSPLNYLLKRQGLYREEEMYQFVLAAFIKGLLSKKRVWK